MWADIDIYLGDYLKTYKRLQLNLKDNIQGVFNLEFTGENLNKYAKKSFSDYFKRYLINLKDNNEIKGKVLYEANKYLYKKNIKNIDILKMMLLCEYDKFASLKNKSQLDLFDNVARYINIKVAEEVMEVKKIRQKYTYEPFVAWEIIARPNNMGMVWSDYRDVVTEYEANQIYNKAVIMLAQNKRLNVNDFKKEFDLQQQRELMYKRNDRNDKFMGRIDNEVGYLINQEKLQLYKYYGISKVRYRAIEDERTTEICQDMDGKIIDVKDLILGVNMPPLHYNCRSWIEAWKV